MQNAKDIPPTHKRFLLWGASGTGKTSQFLTLPGKKFLYIFDPSGVEGIRGYDVDFELILPDSMNLNISSSSADGATRGTKMQQDAPQAAANFLLDLRKKKKEGFFDQYDAVGMDSVTFYAKLVMDRIVWNNQRPGHTPHQDDYAPEMNQVFNAMREFIAIPGCTLFASTHEENKEDKRTGLTNVEYALTGKLRVWLTGLFTDVFRTIVGEKDENIGKHYVVTGKIARAGGIRKSIRWLDHIHEVTIKDWDNLETQGLGAILAEDERRRSA